MNIDLRPYQKDMIGGARTALKNHKSILLQAPTGAGKTVLASFMIGQCRQRGESAWFICHRAELVDGTSKTFRKFGIDHSLIAAGNNTDLRQLVQICSIDTLKGRLAMLKPPKLAVIDECHHASAAGWAKVITWLREGGAFVVGLSATPQRLDGKGLDDLFEFLVPGPKVSWLINSGFLSPYTMFSIEPPNMTAVRRRMGDYDKKEAEERINKPKLAGNIVRHWREKANGLRTIMFAMNRNHSLQLVDELKRAGIKAAHLDGETPANERRALVQGFADGDFDILSNVSLFGEGFDLSSIAQRDVTIDAMIDVQPTQSLSLYLQKCGRVLRPRAGKTAILLDHAGNHLVHGYPDDDREWALVGSSVKEKRGSAANDNTPLVPYLCVQCYNSIKRSTPEGKRIPLPDACPYCGKRIAPEFKEIEVDEDAELVEHGEAEKARVRALLKREQAEAKTYEDLIALGHKRKYKNPQYWAKQIWEKRRKK